MAMGGGVILVEQKLKLLIVDLPDIVPSVTPPISRRPPGSVAGLLAVGSDGNEADVAQPPIC